MQFWWNQLAHNNKYYDKQGLKYVYAIEVIYQVKPVLPDFYLPLKWV